jgi:valyl-tRNA synthetase
MDAAGIPPSLPEPGTPEMLEDRWIFSRLSRTAASVNRALEQHRYHEVAEELWQFFWHDFCDWYLEVKKLRQAPGSGLTNDWRNILGVFSAYLRLQHPLMPFITEELWHRFGQEQSIALAPYPQAGATDAAAEHEMELMQEMITAARKLRADHGIDPKLLLEGVLYCRNGARDVELEVVEKFATVKLDVRTGNAPDLSGAVRSTPEFDLVLRLPEVDREIQIARLVKEIAQLEKAIADKDRQLANEKFLKSAPPQVVEALRTKRAEQVAQLEKSRATLNTLQ